MLKLVKSYRLLVKSVCMVYCQLVIKKSVFPTSFDPWLFSRELFHIERFTDLLDIC